MRTLKIFIAERIQADIPGSVHPPNNFRDACDPVADSALGRGL